jgi:hypothetical protein
MITPEYPPRPTRRDTGPSARRALPLVLCSLVLLVGLGAAALAATEQPGPAPVTVVDGAVTPVGYWLVASDGGVFAYGGAPFLGSMGGLALNRPIVGMAATPDARGYWLVATDGGVFAFGDAAFFGSSAGKPLNSPVVAIATSPDGRGYWLVASDGGVFAFGDAAFHGSAGDRVLPRPVVDITPTPTGAGYWLAASDGGVFDFGDAAFHGSAAGTPLARPVGTIDATADGGGYWLAASDGGVFSYGDAGFHGSAVGLATGGPVVDLRSTPSDGGYWVAAADGGVFAFGDARFFGSAVGTTLHRPVVGMAADDQPTVPDRSFTVAGDIGPPLLPGGHAPIDLVVTNRNPVPITVVSNRTSVTTGSSSCPPSEFAVTQGLTRPVVVPASATASLSSLGVDPSDWPSIAMPDTAVDQDACQGRHVVLHYEALAVG